MELVLKRIAKRKAYTIGRLSIVEPVLDEYLAGSKETYFSDTLEPTALELKTTVSKEAVLRSPEKAQSLKPFAISEGRYAVVISWSPKFKAWLPILLGVPNFEGIRIHAGNTAKDTQGCILLGVGLNLTGGHAYLEASRAAMRTFRQMLSGVDRFTLEIKP